MGKNNIATGLIGVAISFAFTALTIYFFVRVAKYAWTK